jgi:Tfp pilus assembly protein PilF
VNFLAAALAATATVASVTFPVTTSDAQAQAAIDRGLFLYYAYDGDDAAREFEQAIGRDPRLAIGYWGVALALGPDLNTPISQSQFDGAARAIQTALPLVSTLSDRERRFVEIMALRYRGSFADWSADDTAYRRALFDFAESSHDENAELLAAEALLEHSGLGWANGTPASAEARTALQLVVAVLHDDPSNVMANHLCIHLYDQAPDRAPALPCAQRLDATAFPPQAEHLAHMPAHYWIETGAYAKALASSERAYALMTQLTALEPDSPHVERYTKHIVAVGYSAAMMLGNYASAQRWGARMSAAFGIGFDGITDLRFGRYDAAATATGDQFAGAAVRGLAALHLGQLAQARAIAGGMPATASLPGYLPQIFFAELASTQGAVVQADRWIERARAYQQANFEGELIPLVPADEALGAIRLRRGEDGGAVAAFQAALAAYPNDPRALLGLAQAQRARGDGSQANETDDAFQRQWEGADTAAAGILP